MRISIISSSRADWSPLGMVAKCLRGVKGVEIFPAIVYSRDDFESRSAAIEFDLGDIRFNPLPTSVDPMLQASTAVSAGEVYSGVVSHLMGCFPDIAVICGDRYEALAAATACYYMKVPIVHLSGGDITLGSADDRMRDAISMLAALHFPTHKQAADRLKKIVPNPEMVFDVGSPAIDRIMWRRIVSHETSAATKKYLSGEINVLICCHPDTVHQKDEIGPIIEACERVQAEKNVNFLYVSPNADFGAHNIRWSLSRTRFTRLPELLPDDFIDLLCQCQAIVGNSSCGIYEAPAVGTWTINVGHRQSGRPIGAGVFDVAAVPEDIFGALMALICKSKSLHPGSSVSQRGIFGAGNASARIMARIMDTFDVR